ncbi:MAG: sugar transferase, partial [Acidobacteriaceae bacterium]
MSLPDVDKSSIPLHPLFEPASSDRREVLNEGTFKRMIAVERKRTERSREPFLLMLLETGNQEGSVKRAKALDNMISALLLSIRETDVIGWYRTRTTAAVIFTGLEGNDKNIILKTILTRVSATLRNELTLEQFSQISISSHFFPDDWEDDDSGHPSNPSLYPDLLKSDSQRRVVLTIKRMMDIAGSALILVLLTPLFLAIYLAIKMSSKGPALFQQHRVGQHGRKFI